METVIYKSSIEAIQDGNLDIGSKAADNMFFHETISKSKSEEMDLKLKQKVNYNGSDSTPKTPKESQCNDLTGSASGTEPEKTLSPTLIEHAFKVVKNLFSPEKSRSKPNNVINQQRSSSGSPHSSIYIPNKPDFYNLQEGDLDSPVNCSTPTDGSFKGENFSGNQMGPLPIALNYETFNESFTTASLIDESFKSAVTHFDENLKNDNLEHENKISDSQNLNILDVSSASNSDELGLDNTLLKNSLTHIETKPQNISNNNNNNNNVNNFNNAGTPNVEGNESGTGTNEKYLLINQTNCSGAPLDGSRNEKNSEKKVEQLLEPKEISEHSLLPESEILTMGKTILSNGGGGNTFGMVSPSRKDEIKILKSASASNNCLKSTENTEKQNIVENVIIRKENDKKGPEKTMADVKSFNTEDAVKQLGILDSAAEFSEETNKNGLPTEHKKVAPPAEAKEEDCSLQNEDKKEVESSISTTTITLSESDSILDFHDSLKENCSEPDLSLKNTTSVTISPCSNDFISPKSKKMLCQIDNNNKQQKRIIKSEANTPNKTNNPNKNKLNKSADSALIKSTGKNSRRKPWGQKRKEETFDEKFDPTFENLTYFPVKVPNSNIDEENSKNESNSQNSPSIASQQSYTVLNTVDKNLQRPIIHSSEDLNSDLVKCKSEEWNRSLHEESDLENFTTSNEQSGISAKNVSRLNTTKTSTPVSESPQNERNILCSKVLDPAGIEKELHSDVDSPVLNFSLKNEVPLEFSPILSEGQKEVQLSYASDNEKSPSNFGVIGSGAKLEQSSKNNKSDQANQQLSQTYNKIQVQEEFKSCKPEGALTSPKVKNFNQTFEIETETSENIMNQTYDKNPNKLNSTYSKKRESFNRTFDVPDEPANNFNQTFDVPAEPANNFNRTFDVPAEPTNNFNQTFDKMPSIPAGVNQKHSKMNESNTTCERTQTEAGISKKMCNEDVIEAKACPTTIIEKPFLESKLPVIFDEGTGDNIEGLNNSFSPNSSAASLFLTNNSTMVLQQGNIVDDLSSASKETFQSINQKKDEEERSTDPGKSISPDDFQIQNHSIFVNKQLPASPKYDKVHCDLELVQLIQEQFSSTDIEKICSVVDDMSMKKLSSQIQKASEQYVKSLHDVIPNGDLDAGKSDSFSEKSIGVLSPQGFEFLSSIQGKPTGRDLSRESLYVKFDPLVQPPNSSSLIDFTKEVESVFSALECIPENVAVGETDSCKNLLTISPEKKPDDIVPPLTPLSQRGKNNLRDDEKLKCLQNEIYFLKHLIGERERENREKKEDLENQITKLTGEKCVLEDMIKESSEREKSLAKKVKEQNQNLEELKVVFEEYNKFIVKLSGELEQLKKESKSQLEALVAEKDSYVVHLQNTEAAFSDVHAKYEKSKKIIMNMKSNEATLRTTIAEQMQKLEEYKGKAKAMEEEACREFQKMQEELAETKANQSQELTRVKALLRRHELKVQALQESLDQKINENKQLTAICDELIEGKK